MSRRRPLVLLGSLVGGIAAVVALAAPAHAESISSITTQATVDADTSMHVVETIVYDFGDLERHGIFRDLPVYDILPQDQRRYYDVSVAGVTQDGQPATYEELDQGQYLRLKVGDADVTINGRHTYVIDYTVRKALRVVTPSDLTPQMPEQVAAGDVELYWDLIGTGWDVPILSAQATVTGPAPPLTASCFHGSTGSTADCPTSTSGATSTFGPVSLDSYAGLTASVIWPRAAFTVAPVEDVQAAPAIDVPAGVWAFLGAIPLAGAAAIVPGVVAAFLRRKDKGVDLAAAPPQYSAPDDVSPAELMAAWKGLGASTNSRVLVATLLDLTARGWLTLNTVNGLMIGRTAGGTGELRDWERELIDELVPGPMPVTLEKYDRTHTAIWTGTFSELVTRAEQSGRRNPLGDKPDQRWNWLGGAAAGFFAVGILVAFFGGGAVTAALMPLAIGCLIGFGVARLITPRRETQQSAEFIAKVKGLERVLSTDPAAGRRELALRLGLPPVAVMATMLPFAVVFKLENSWLGAFPDLTPADLATTGFGVATMYDLGNLVGSTTSYAAAATASPSSGSSGGGSSGGGGGGGGGGSW